MERFKNKRVLVTGGSGFIASHLCRRLVENGARLFILTKYNSIIDNIRIVNIWDKITMVEGDIRNPDSLRQIKSIRPDLIYHFAAYNHVGDSFMNISEAIDVNSKGTVNVIDAYEDYERFVYISSSEVYGFQKCVPFSEDMVPFPVSPYSVGKYSGELYVRMKSRVYKKPVVILRPFNAFGPFQSPRAVIAEIIIKCLKGEDVITTEGIQTREFNYIENLVDAFIMAGIKKEAIGETINIGTGQEMPIRLLVRKIHKLTSSRSRLCIGKISYRPTEIWRMAASNKKAKMILGWEPRISFEDGLIKTIEWYQKFNHLFFETDSPLYRLCQETD
ncbi:MAG: GDP-mannose 4,6-dehydratase [Candidatus Omnitrophica bacterium]|nr:GDP-mannose 4,6-dehydratase [Candidatus Omnitrophota bacterium]